MTFTSLVTLTSREQGFPNQQEVAQINSQRLKQHTQGLLGSALGLLCVYYGFQFSVFISIVLLILNLQISEFLTLVPSLRPFSFCSFILSNLNITVFALSYILLSYI